MTNEQAWHIPELGQSLGLGLDAGGRVLTDPGALPPRILMFNGGVRPMDAQQVVPLATSVGERLAPASIAGLVPAREGSVGGRFHETHLCALAAQLDSQLEAPAATITVSGHGVGATGYADLRRGNPPFDNLLAAVAAHARLARQAGRDPVVPFVTMVHGERDGGLARADYAGYLAELLTDIRREIPALTGQPVPPFLAVSQIGVARRGKVSEVALAQLGFGIDCPDGLCSGPKYHWRFSDKLHLTSDSYRLLGEMMGKFCAWRLSGRPAMPLRLSGVTRIRPRQLRLSFDVPVPPLRIHGGGPVTDPGTCGIEVFRRAEGWRRVPVEQVTLEEGGTLRVDLGRAVVRDVLQVRVAMQNLDLQGPGEGPRSLICDSDATRGVLTGSPLTNWCAHCVFDYDAPRPGKLPQG